MSFWRHMRPRPSLTNCAANYEISPPKRLKLALCATIRLNDVTAQGDKRSPLYLITLPLAPARCVQMERLRPANGEPAAAPPGELHLRVRTHIVFQIQDNLTMCMRRDLQRLRLVEKGLPIGNV